MEPKLLTPRAIAAQHNPFEVLELGSEATPREVSRQKDTLLGMLELGLDRAKRYASLLGERERTADLVRGAARELERPRSRLLWELWVPPAPVSDSETPPLRTALVLHHELLRELRNAMAIGADEFDALGAAWDDVLGSDELHEQIAERAEALAIDSDDIVSEFGERVRAEMLTMLESAPAMDVDELESETASDVAHRFTDRKIELLELMVSRFTAPSRPPERRQQWEGLTREYDATVARRGEYLRRKAFEAIALPAGNRASELFNKNIDHQLALEAFSWLRDEAKVVGDSERAELHGKNVRIVRQRLNHDHEVANAPATRSRSASAFGGRGVFSLLAVAVMALSRAHSCADTKPSYDSTRYQLGSDLQRKLLEQYDKNPRYRLDVPSDPTPDVPSDPAPYVPSDPTPSAGSR